MVEVADLTLSSVPVITAYAESFEIIGPSSAFELPVTVNRTARSRVATGNLSTKPSAGISAVPVRWSCSISHVVSSAEPSM